MDYREEIARVIIAARRERDRAFGSTLSEPGWEILLDLYAAQLDGKRVNISSVYIAAGIPATTALRWIARLEAEGWVAREPCDKDGRRIFIVPTDKLSARMNAFMDALHHWRDHPPFRRPRAGESALRG